MDFIQIIGYILYAVLLFITVVWAYGIRIKPLVYPTVLMGVYFLIASIVFSFSDVNKIHLAWVIPLIYVTVFINAKIILTPVISIPFRLICDLYAGILRVGKK